MNERILKTSNRFMNLNEDWSDIPLQADVRKEAPMLAKNPEEPVKVSIARPIFKSLDGRLKYSISKNEDDEWVAKAYVDGKYNEPKTIYSEDKEESISNAKDGIERWNKLTDEQKDSSMKESVKIVNKLIEESNKLLKD